MQYIAVTICLGRLSDGLSFPLLHLALTNLDAAHICEELPLPFCWES